MQRPRLESAPSDVAAAVSGTPALSPRESAVLKGRDLPGQPAPCTEGGGPAAAHRNGWARLRRATPSSSDHPSSHGCPSSNAALTAGGRAWNVATARLWGGQRSMQHAARAATAAVRLLCTSALEECAQHAERSAATQQPARAPAHCSAGRQLGRHASAWAGRSQCNPRHGDNSRPAAEGGMDQQAGHPVVPTKRKRGCILDHAFVPGEGVCWPLTLKCALSSGLGGSDLCSEIKRRKAPGLGRMDRLRRNPCTHGATARNLTQNLVSGSLTHGAVGQ